MLEELQTTDKIVGLKQSVRMLQSGMAKKAFIAKDAAPNVTDTIVALCNEKKVPVKWVKSMSELGKASGIEVGAAVTVVY